MGTRHIPSHSYKTKLFHLLLFSQTSKELGQEIDIDISKRVSK
jgi:hypothetical protein